MPVLSGRGLSYANPNKMIRIANIERNEVISKSRALNIVNLNQIVFPSEYFWSLKHRKYPQN